MFRLLNRPPAWMDRAVVQAFRQFTEEFSVVLNDLSGLIERISLLQEEIGARQLEQSNRTLYTLTVITVLALPINIVAGFFGMNVGGIPLASNHHGFILLVVIVAVFTLGAGYRRFAGAMTCRLRVESAEAAQGGNQSFDTAFQLLARAADVETQKAVALRTIGITRHNRHLLFGDQRLL